MFISPLRYSQCDLMITNLQASKPNTPFGPKRQNFFRTCIVLTASLIPTDSHSLGTTDCNANLVLADIATKSGQVAIIGFPLLGLLGGLSGVLVSGSDEKDDYNADRDCFRKRNNPK